MLALLVDCFCFNLNQNNWTRYNPIDCEPHMKNFASLYRKKTFSFVAVNFTPKYYFLPFLKVNSVSNVTKRTSHSSRCNSVKSCFRPCCSLLQVCNYENLIEFQKILRVRSIVKRIVFYNYSQHALCFAAILES